MRLVRSISLILKTLATDYTVLCESLIPCATNPSGTVNEHRPQNVLLLKGGKTTHNSSLHYLNSMTATLDLPVNLAVSMLRKAGTGDNLLATLDALVNYTDENEVAVEEVTAPTEWVNEVNLEDENEVVEATVDF